MHELLNVLYVQTQGAVLHLEHDTVRVSVDGETKLRAPLLRLGGIVVFGQVTLTPFLIQRCAEDGRGIVDGNIIHAYEGEDGVGAAIWIQGIEQSTGENQVIYGQWQAAEQYVQPRLLRGSVE